MRSVRVQLKARRQCSGESIQEFEANVYRLTTLAYPEENKENITHQDLLKLIIKIMNQLNKRSGIIINLLKKIEDNNQFMEQKLQTFMN